MSRWEPGIRERLQEAALNLFAEQGFENTTVAEIAGRVGVNRRTFFRNFADKRDVLFSYVETLQGQLCDAIEESPTELAPLDAIAAALTHLDQLMAPRQYLRQRQAVIAASPELTERELIKFDALTTAFHEGLLRRGVVDSVGRLAAQAGMTIYRISFDRWISPDNEEEMSLIVKEVLSQFRVAVMPS